MIKAKAYAAQNPNEKLAPWDFERRDVGNHDVQIEFYTVEYVILIWHKLIMNGFPECFRWFPVMKL